MTNRTRPLPPSWREVACGWFPRKTEGVGTDCSLRADTRSAPTVRTWGAVRAVRRTTEDGRPYRCGGYHSAGRPGVR
ncbi:MAG: hypothetical protein FWB93_06300, partial [Oscillospiraceae bacterium]|nr:hypothetical protein [Oscillospiraceae bacterium]